LADAPELSRAESVYDAQGDTCAKAANRSMKRLAFHLLLAIALILQGSVAAFGEGRSHTMHGPCCPDAAATVDAGFDPSDCPCPSKQHCTIDCQLMCAAGQAAIAAPTFSAARLSHAESPLIAGADSLRPRSDTPPIRPPIA